MAGFLQQLVLDLPNSTHMEQHTYYYTYCDTIKINEDLSGLLWAIVQIHDHLS